MTFPVGRKRAAKHSSDRGPEIRTMAIPPSPTAVAGAIMVSFKIKGTPHNRFIRADDESYIAAKWLINY